MKLITNIGKYIGFMALAILCNGSIILLLRNQNQFNLTMKWGLGIVYTLFIITAFFFLWKY
ncbi:hypothetical protein [Streptococcus sobrinus]|uniref:hypothetical protein n=1 Tax=Streptococcus sobrinus TaxID=1310 RepID=UPI00036C6888